uniref:von Willebrand factor A domain-containing protein 3A n=1 Tax=Phallusia mammillata TaxID=59560 RepID=A0A6F9DX92_9ASCI|nr:von Willebrand factor A domain-containing protein 3A [Phallusia mammillata]
MEEILDNAQFLNGADISSQCDEAKHFGKRKAWKMDSLDRLSIVPQSDLIVTHVNQTLDLQKAKAFSAVPNKSQTSEEWLSNHSIEHQKLTLKDLLQRGKQVRKAGEGKHLVFDATVITEIEYKLNVAIEQYHKRVKWLLEGSKKLFGLVKGDRVGVLIDSSDANTGFGRLQDFQQSLLYLIDEQLQHKKSLYLLSFGSEPENLWNHARDVNIRILEEARDFIRGLHPAGGCNLLKAFKKILKVKKLNSILIILGNCPDQTSNVLFDYIQQCLLGKKLPIHAVAYDTSNHMTHETLRKLAECSNGRYHCFNSSDDREVYKSFDIQLLLREAQRSIDVISKIKQMRTGMLGDALISIENEISMEVNRLSTARFLPRPPNHHRPLSIETPNFHPAPSSEWLAENGLKARSLNLFQILAPNAFDPVQDFIPILRKSVGSKIHGQAMQQFEWHDGSVKNVHVDVAMLYEYQKQLGSAVKAFEKRIEWLASGSRRIWGTICEKRVIFLVDTSISNKAYVIHIQHSLRLMMEQQIANKEAFNIIAFGSHPKMWKPHMVKPSPENLQAAWRWVQNLEAFGSRNLLSAFRASIENEEDIKLYGRPQGLYLFTSGIPDQEEDVVCSFVSETCIGCELKIHCDLFSIDDYSVSESELPSRYATIQQTADYLRNLAHCSGGRFHWFRETGIVESDDIIILTCEMDRAVYFSNRCSQLVDSVKERDGLRREQMALKQLMLCDGPTTARKKRPETPKQVEFIEPRPTALTRARMSMQQEGDAPKALAWKVPNRKATLPSVPYGSAESSDANGQKATKSKKSPKSQQQPFYVEDKNNVGVVYKKYPKQKSVRKAVPEPIFPQVEERISTKAWLKKYGINKLKLNLHRYVSGPVCIHEKSKVKTAGSTITSKWFCSIFPSAEIDGEIRHIDMQESEMDDYELHVTSAIHRYLKRLQWLLSGSRRLFGNILENNVVILIDISGSMSFYMEELKKEMTSLIWEQLNASKIAFNLISFSNATNSWQESVTEANETSCHDAVQWVSSLKPLGGTATLDALQIAFEDKDAEAIYLMTDGKPDTSVKLTLEKAHELNKGKIPVHTISFNCDDRTANDFLKKLAATSGGRFHRSHGEADAHFAAHRLMQDGCLDEDDPNLPSFEGDDLRKLNNEITKGRKFLTQARHFRDVIRDHKDQNRAEPEAQTSSGDKKMISNKPFLP